MNTSEGNTGSTSSTPKRLLAAALILGSVGAQAAIIPSQGTWTTTLQGRDASGNPVALLSGGAPNHDMKYVYDTVLDLTWLADWAGGLMRWHAANAWAASLTDFGGGWVLPSVLDIGNDGCNYADSGTDCGYNVYGSEAGRRDSPLAHMYYDTLGNKGYRDASGVIQPDFGLNNTGPFSNMQSGSYWSSTADASALQDAFFFLMNQGTQGSSCTCDSQMVVAVRPGDVFAASVPEPEGLALLGLSFGALAVVRRRRTP